MRRSKVDQAIFETTRDWAETVQSQKAFCGFDGERPIAHRIKTVDARGEHFEAHLDDHKQPIPIKGKARVVLVQEIDVDEDMANSIGNLHGGCGAYLLDVCTSHALKAYDTDSLGHGWRFTGVTTDMTVRFLNAAPIGTKLRMTSTVISIGQRLAVIDFVAIDKETGRTVFVGSHCKASTPVKAKM